MDSFLKESNKLKVLNSNSPKLKVPAKIRANYNLSPDNIIKYLRSSSLSGSGSSSSGKSSFRSSASPQSEKTPVKVVGEDVLVMDEVLVASDTNIVGSGPSSSSSGSGGFHKSEVCRAWEEYGNCRYGSRCQFAHGKEEVSSSCFPLRSKSEAQQIHKSYSSIVSSPYGSKSRLSHPVMETAAIVAQKDPSTRPRNTSQSSSALIKPEETTITSFRTIQPEPTRLTANFTMRPKTKAPTSKTRPEIDAISFTNRTNWSPQDDGIDVTLPSLPGKTPSREDVDAYIDSVLYGLATMKRLPVFSQLCPE